GPHPRNFSQEFFDAAAVLHRRVIDAVRPKRSRFTLEIMGWALPEGPDSYLRLIKAIDREGFAVHLDVCNGINSPERFYNNSRFIAECFEKLGPWIVSCHAKDLQWEIEMNVHFVEVVPGRGQVDYGEYLRQLARLKVDAPLMLEHLKTPQEYDEGVRYIREVARKAGLSFA
ncbi:MAG TPA: TIM barrel protein, partial [Bryobacteraceae bacterium]|nr:TIM barrel protein [Bryobacteraceae bacterium]